MRALITGVTGFVASHLADFLLERNVEVYGTVRRRSSFENIQHIRGRLHLVETDIQDPHSVETALKEVEPDYIFHLVAQSFMPTSWRSPLETIESNIIGTLNMLEAARKFGRPENTDMRLLGGVRSRPSRGTPYKGDQPPPLPLPLWGV